jgi:hypothetical protein
MFLIWAIETILDSVLILGHYWDLSAPIFTVINCRLFYISISCFLVQSLTLLKSPHFITTTNAISNKI